MSWLDCSSEAESGKKVVAKLKYKVGTEFEEKIKGRKNFSSKWIIGADSVRISNVCDHAHNDHHTHAMSLLKKQRAVSAGLGPSSYAPIAQALAKPDDDEREKLRVKFDIAYFVASENLPFMKYPRICELEAHHGVSVGTSYANENAGKEFIHYIAMASREELKQQLASAKFFSLLLDGSTDKGNIDNEVIFVVWCDHHGTDKKVHTRMKYFTSCCTTAICHSSRFLKQWSLGCRVLALTKSQLNIAKSLLELAQMVYPPI